MSCFMTITTLGEETTITVRAAAEDRAHIEREAALAAQARRVPVVAAGAVELIDSKDHFTGVPHETMRW